MGRVLVTGAGVPIYVLRLREALPGDGRPPVDGIVRRRIDDALAESFFATLECELLERMRFRSQVEARMAVFDFIKGWYNSHRRHSSIGYLSPVNFEKINSEPLSATG
jgi:putative transposase